MPRTHHLITQLLNHPPLHFQLFIFHSSLSPFASIACGTPRRALHCSLVPDPWSLCFKSHSARNHLASRSIQKDCPIFFVHIRDCPIRVR